MLHLPYINRKMCRSLLLFIRSSYLKRYHFAINAPQLLMIWITLILLIWTKISVSGQSETPSKTQTAKQQSSKTINENCQILVLGDSLSAAYGLKLEQGWVQLLQQQLHQRSKTKNCTIINASISGETTSGGLIRLPRLLTQYQPTILILQLGANDGLRGLPIQKMMLNIENMIRTAQQKKIKVLLVGMQIPPNYGPNYSAQFSQSFIALENKLKVARVHFLLDGFAENPDAFQADGIHPNAHAQTQMMNNIWKELAKLLS